MNSSHSPQHLSSPTSSSSEAPSSFTTTTTTTEDVVVVNLANCINQTVGELNALKALVFDFAAKFEEKLSSKVPSSNRKESFSEAAAAAVGLTKIRFELEKPLVIVEDDDEGEEEEEEEEEKDDSEEAKMERNGFGEENSRNAVDDDDCSRGNHNYNNNNNDGDNNNSSAVPNKNERIPEKERENALHQFGNFVVAWRAVDAKVLTDLIPLMLASELFVTDQQLNRWKKKQCTEVFYIPMKSGAQGVFLDSSNRRCRC